MTSPGPDPAEPAAPFPGSLEPPRYDQPPHDEPQYGQPQYGQPQYGQPQYGQPQYGQPQYGQPQYGQPQYGQPPDSQPPYGRVPAPYAGPPAYGYGDAPPASGTQYGPPGGFPGAFPGDGPVPGQWGPWGPPPAPPGVVLIPGRPPLRAATPGQRTIARLIDSIGYAALLAVGIVAVVLIVKHAADTSYSYDYGYPSSTGGDGLELLWIYPILGLVWLLILAYESLMIGLTGSTLGGRVAGVRFVRTSDGDTPGFGRALGRAAFLGGCFVVCYGLVFLLVLLSMFFDNVPGRYQSWVDKICGMQAVSSKE